MRTNPHKRQVVKAAQLFFILSLVVISCSLSSCFKKDKPLKPPSYSGKINVINMGPGYADQFFYSLEANQVISSNSRNAYDLMFDCGTNNFHIWLNTAKFMCAYNTNKTDFNSVTATDTLTNKTWVYERGSYNVDSSALGNWWQTLTSQPTSAKDVYVINLGPDSLGNALGFVKMQVQDFYGSSYTIRYASLTNSDSGTITVPKDDTRNYRYATLSGSGQLVDGIEPDKSTWDLCFTRFSTVIYDPPTYFAIPYAVTGVLHNPFKVEAYVDSTINYDSVTISKFNLAKLQTNRDAIGYDWKDYTGGHAAGGTYIAKKYYVYFIQTGPNTYYKLHFLNFLNSGGLFGYPSFEYEQL